ncbi:hypothetical protein HYPSUDRAFT_37560 [Hypholoma sublateritium FD-334 SS-4]|uniref:Uncharacterized protein n=1 Tax=Hypholoma sublateritium (strain FD-334 SS-4) TaxID=945553 RepID=A0A0D2P3V9_HYPSF|nr:hypothetical protein HYPSUDRAFT_37560 [Hypholoma sublateritium FD-334 SS-4]
MSSDPNSAQGDKFSYPRKVLELGKSQISTTTFNKAVETEPDPSVKANGFYRLQESKAQVNELAKALQPITYFRDKPPIATTSNIIGIHNGITVRRENFESESNKAKAREELQKTQDNELPTLSRTLSRTPQLEPTSSPIQRPVDKHIVNYQGARFSQDSVTDHYEPATTTTPVHVERPPSEAYSLSQIPRAPSLDQAPHALPPPPRPRKAQIIAAPSLATIGQAHIQQPTATDTETTVKIPEPTGSMKPTASLVLPTQSSMTSGQVSRKGKHRRGINTGGADGKQEQPATGTFGQPSDFTKAGINPGESFGDNK